MKSQKQKIKNIIQAIKIAERNVKKNLGGPFGTVIVKNGRIVSVAANSVARKNDPTAHAEIEAIRKASKKLKSFDLSGCEIYSSCEPCPMCLSAIYWSNIKKIYYAATANEAAKSGFRDDFIYKELAKPASNRKVKEISFDIPQKSVPFKLWKKSANKIKY